LDKKTAVGFYTNKVKLQIDDRPIKTKVVFLVFEKLSTVLYYIDPAGDDNDENNHQNDDRRGFA
jgi:hypothetical protein